ncbi:hypothetical protein MSPP1_001375 [Malassezia sp. CBS 17886]|nr:hypothetical protein MSPP1_001375 [Malassezia sp. CBS 17886]
MLPEADAAAARAPEDDDVVASLPVYLSAPANEADRLELFQYPLYPRRRPLPVPSSAVQRGQQIASRWRPHADRVEMDIPLDVRESIYNRDRGSEYAQSLAHMDSIDLPHAADRVHVKQEGGGDAHPRFDRMRLEGVPVPHATSYMVGTILNGELHLTPLHSTLQLRPSMQHLDFAQADDGDREREHAGGAGAASDGEHADAQQAKRMNDLKRSGVVSLNVSMRADSGASRTGGGTSAPHMGHPPAPLDVHLAQREADAERWVNLQWRDESVRAPCDAH